MRCQERDAAVARHCATARARMAFRDDGRPTSKPRSARPGAAVRAPLGATAPLAGCARSACPRRCASLGCVAAIARDEAVHAPARLRFAAPRRARRARRAARAAAQRVARALGELKGPFAKAGQFAVAPLRRARARACARRFATLQDRVPPRPFAEIVALRRGGARRAARRALRRVRARRRSAPRRSRRCTARASSSGERVAVKVQYPWLAHSLPADLALARLLLRALGGAPRRAASRARLFDEFAAGLAEELDFEREARVAARDRREPRRRSAGRGARDPPRALDAPRADDELPAGDPDRATAPRSRAAASRCATCSRRSRAPTRSRSSSTASSTPIPHPGNLFVIDEPDAAVRPRVLFIDFGLSKRLDPALRRELRLGIHALLRRDVEGFLDGMERMGMIAPGARDGVRARSRRCSSAWRARGTGARRSAAAQVLRAEGPGQARCSSETPGLQLPNDLLLYAKTMSYLFALGDAARSRRWT